jgi:hypothetical protein
VIVRAEDAGVEGAVLVGVEVDDLGKAEDVGMVGAL